MVKWSACLPSTPTIRVRILLTHTVFSVKFEMNENKQKEARVYVTCTYAFNFVDSDLFFRKKLIQDNRQFSFMCALSID